MGPSILHLSTNKRGVTSFNKMKVALVFLTIAVSYAHAQTRPCGDFNNIDECKCDDVEQTAVAHPRMCKKLEANVVSCSCVDGSEWEPPCGGFQNVAGCAVNEQTGTFECTCDDGTVFTPSRGGRGRGRGRGGRGGNGGGNGDGDEDEDDNEEEGENGGRGGRGRGGRGGRGYRGGRGRGK